MKARPSLSAKDTVLQILSSFRVSHWCGESNAVGRAAVRCCFLMLNFFSNIIQRKRRVFSAKIITGWTLFTFTWCHYNVHEERSCLGRDRRSNYTWKRLRENDCFLPVEFDSSFLKGPSWQLSAEVIYWKTTERRLEVLQVGKKLLFTVLRSVGQQDKNILFFFWGGGGGGEC